jgi:hypothetical protein
MIWTKGLKTSKRRPKQLISSSADIALSSVEAAVFPIGCDCRHLLPGAGPLLPPERGRFMARAYHQGQRKKIGIGFDSN